MHDVDAYVILFILQCSIRNFQDEDAETFEVASSRETTEGQDKVADQVFGNPENRTTGTGISLLAKLAIALGVAATITLLSVGFERYMNGSPQGVNYLGHGSPASVLTAPSAGFTLNVFGHKVVIPEYAPGYADILLSSTPDENQ